MDPLYPLDEPRPLKRKKLPLIIMGLIVIGLLGWTGVSLFFKIKFGDFQPPFSAPNVVVSPAETRTIQDKIEAIGTTKASQSAVITTNVSETIIDLPVAEGSFVKKGTIIAVLNNTGEQASVAEAQQAFNRFNELAKLKIASEARREEEQAKLEVANAALAERVIRAPFDGVLGLINLDIGEMAMMGTALTTLDNINPLEVEFSIPENQISNLSIAMPINATTDAYKNEIFKGLIKAIDTRIDPNTRTLRVKADIDNSDQRLKPGMLMKTNIITAVRPALIIPEGAVASKGNQKSVLAIGKNDKGEAIAVEKIVTIGSHQTGFVEILSGLNESDKVIIEGQIKAQPDTQVKVIATKSVDDVTKAALGFSVDRKRTSLEEEPVTRQENPASETETKIKTEEEPSAPTESDAQPVSPLVITPSQDEPAP